MQAWGHNSKFSLRQTLPFPTKSGVFGLLLASLGAGGSQEELLEKLEKMQFTVFAFSHHSVSHSMITDFQMVGNGYSTKGWESLFIPRKRDGAYAVGGGAKLTFREYLQDAVFSVIMTVPDDLYLKLEESLTVPKWPLYLGRKNCIPSKPVFGGMFEDEDSAQKRLQELADGYDLLFRVVEGKFPEQGDVMITDDVPLCFGEHKRYRSRYVTVIKEASDEQ